MQHLYKCENIDCKYLNQCDKIELKRVITSLGLLAGESPAISKVAM